MGYLYQTPRQTIPWLGISIQKGVPETLRVFDIGMVEFFGAWPETLKINENQSFPKTSHSYPQPSSPLAWFWMRCRQTGQLLGVLRRILGEHSAPSASSSSNEFLTSSLVYAINYWLLVINNHSCHPVNCLQSWLQTSVTHDDLSER